MRPAHCCHLIWRCPSTADERLLEGCQHTAHRPAAAATAEAATKSALSLAPSSTSAEYVHQERELAHVEFPRHDKLPCMYAQPPARLAPCVPNLNNHTSTACARAKLEPNMAGRAAACTHLLIGQELLQGAPLPGWPRRQRRALLVQQRILRLDNLHCGARGSQPPKPLGEVETARKAAGCSLCSAVSLFVWRTCSAKRGQSASQSFSALGTSTGILELRFPGALGCRVSGKRGQEDAGMPGEYSILLGPLQKQLHGSKRAHLTIIRMENSAKSSRPLLSSEQKLWRSWPQQAEYASKKGRCGPSSMYGGRL